MRRLGFAAALAIGLGAGTSTALAQGSGSQGITPQAMLGLKPAQSIGVEYETPAGQAAIDTCKVETLSDQGRVVGYLLRDGQGKILRKFLSTKGGKGLDQWSYYQDGFEVYRESDLDGDRRADEVRWLNAGGTRIATVRDNKIVGWKRLSAEEATKVAVQAIAAGDVGVLDSILATPEELAAAGLPKSVLARLAGSAEKRNDQIASLTAAVKSAGEKAAWSKFDGTLPHGLAADPTLGLSKDVVLYENAMIFVSPPAAGGQPSKLTMLQVPEMIQFGEVWKFVELPRAVDPDKPVVASTAGIRSALYEVGDAPAGAPHDEAMEAALKALADFDKANAEALSGAGERRETAAVHLKRVPLLKEVAAAAKDAEEKLNYEKQAVDSLAAAYQTGSWSKGRESIEGIVKGGGPLGSYASYRLIGADFVLRNEEPNSNFVANQKKWMTDLENFLKEFPKSDEAPEVWLQLGSSNEFNAEEDKAREDYKTLVADFPDTPAGKKAAGALKRLDLEGKSLAIQGTGADGSTVDTSALAGKPTLVVFWASWGGQTVSRELPDIAKLVEKNASKGLQIVGVCLDNDKAQLEAFQKEHDLDWPQIFESNGIDGRLAVEYGIISLPTIFLVDGQGKVVNRNLRSASEVERQLEKTLSASKPQSVAAGVN